MGLFLPGCSGLAVRRRGGGSRGRKMQRRGQISRSRGLMEPRTRPHPAVPYHCVWMGEGRPRRMPVRCYQGPEGVQFTKQSGGGRRRVPGGRIDADTPSLKNRQPRPLRTSTCSSGAGSRNYPLRPVRAEMVTARQPTAGRPRRGGSGGAGGRRGGPGRGRRGRGGCRAGWPGGSPAGRRGGRASGPAARARRGRRR